MRHSSRNLVHDRRKARARYVLVACARRLFCSRFSAGPSRVNLSHATNQRFLKALRPFQNAVFCLRVL